MEEVKPLSACFTTSPDTIYAGSEVTFDASCNNLSGVYYEWYFGDSGITHDYDEDTPVIIHAYPDTGSYNFSLFIQDTAFRYSQTNQTAVAQTQRTIIVK